MNQIWDDLENEDFDVIEFVNRRFPDEDSLKNLDQEIEDVKLQILKIDKEIMSSIHDHAIANQRTREELDNANILTSKLVSEIKVYLKVNSRKIS